MPRPEAFFDLTYSPDDGGYYCDIFRPNGKELHTTELADDAEMARRDAQRWAKANGYRLRSMGNVAR